MPRAAAPRATAAPATRAPTGADTQLTPEELERRRLLRLSILDTVTEDASRLRALADLIVLALQCDRTRVVSFMQSNASSNQTHPWLDVFDGHHQISHQQGDPVNLAMLSRIDRSEVEHFVYLQERLASIQEPEGSLLDSSLDFFSSEIEDGNAHRHSNLAILLAGRGAGAVQLGRHLRFTGSPPVANLLLTVLRAFGFQDASFGQHGTAPLTL